MRNTCPRNDGMSRDLELIRLARSGDRTAFGEIVRTYQRRVFIVAARIVGERADAEDIVQDTFVRAWKSLDGFDDTRPLGPWLCTIAANRAKTHLQSRKRRATEELTEHVVAPGLRPDEEVRQSLTRSKVMQAMQELSEEQRAVLTLRVLEDLSYEEISAALGIPLGTVMSRLSRAREQMRQRLRP